MKMVKLEFRECGDGRTYYSYKDNHGLEWRSAGYKTPLIAIGQGTARAKKFFKHAQEKQK